MQSQQGIWLFLDSSSVGGIETHVMQLASGLSGAGIPTTILLFNAYPDSPVPDLLQSLISQDTSGHLNTLTLSGRLTGLWQTLKPLALSDRPALIHTHGYKAGLVGRITARLLGIPVASTWHAGEIPDGIVRLYDLLDRYTAPLAQLRFAVSPQIQARLPTTSRVMDNFVDADRIAPSQGTQIAFVGRLSQEKGPDVFVELARRFPDQVFDCYGGGPMQDELTRTAPDNLNLHGMQTDMPSVWSRIGLLVMPSHFEGLPMATLEAMARGIPVLASRVGALPQVIDHNKNGWLATPADPDSFESLLHHWLDHPPEQRSIIRQSARRTIMQRYSSTAVVPEFIKAYQSVAPALASHSGGVQHRR